MKYKIVRKAGLKHIYLRVKDDLTIQVNANPFVKEETIDAFVRSKHHWVVKQMQAISSCAVTDDLSTGSKLYYLGDPVYLQLHQSSRTQSVVLEGNFLRLYFSEPYSQSQIKQMLKQFYLEQSRIIISERVSYWSTVMSLLPNKLTFRQTKTRWGSCSKYNNISLNSQLMQVPIRLIDYVVIHELAHIRVKNHSKQFWFTVSEYCPDYLSARVALKNWEKVVYL